MQFFGVFTVMVNKRDIEILTELLDLEEVKVISHRLHDGIGIILQTEPLIEWGSELLEQIQEVSIDLWKGYKTFFYRINAKCPGSSR
jgi:hypothetical protein